jgi:hypothetical protein
MLIVNRHQSSGTPRRQLEKKDEFAFGLSHADEEQYQQHHPEQSRTTQHHDGAEPAVP